MPDAFIAMHPGGAPAIQNACGRVLSNWWSVPGAPHGTYGLSGDLTYSGITLQRVACLYLHVLYVAWWVRSYFDLE